MRSWCPKRGRIWRTKLCSTICSLKCRAIAIILSFFEPILHGTDLKWKWHRLACCPQVTHIRQTSEQNAQNISSRTSSGTNLVLAHVNVDNLQINVTESDTRAKATLASDEVWVVSPRIVRTALLEVLNSSFPTSLWQRKNFRTKLHHGAEVSYERWQYIFTGKKVSLPVYTSPKICTISQSHISFTVGCASRRRTYYVHNSILIYSEFHA